MLCCCETTEHLTQCNHLVLVCKGVCFPRVNTCPMCTAPLGNRVPTDDSDIDEVNLGILVTAQNKLAVGNAGSMKTSRRAESLQRNH